jgi:hypothetical protein
MSDLTWALKWLKRAQGDLLMARHAFENVYPKLAIALI